MKSTPGPELFQIEKSNYAKKVSRISKYSHFNFLEFVFQTEKSFWNPNCLETEHNLFGFQTFTVLLDNVIMN